MSAGVWDTQGWGAINPSTNAAIADRNELDLWVQYRPTSGPLQGLRVKVQYSDLWQAGKSPTRNRNSGSSSITPCYSVRRQSSRIPNHFFYVPVR